MLRTLFVLTIAAFGIGNAFRGPFYGLLLYLWIAYFRPEYWVWGGFITSLPLSLIAGVMLLGSSVVSGTRFRFDLRTGLLFALLAHSLTSALLSPHVAYAFPYWTDFAKCIVVTYLMSCVVTDPGKFRLVLIVIVASLGLEVTKQGWAQLITNPGATNTNEHAVLGDNNGVAMGALMLIPLLSALSQTATSKWEKRLYTFVTVGTAYRAISTYSRGGFLCAGALIALHVFRSGQKLRTAIGILVVVGIIVPVLPPAFWDRMGTIAFSEDELEEDDASSRGRLHFWRVAVAMANANPILGVGHNSYNPSYNTYDFLRGLYGRGRAVHSSWFGIFAELGYPGLTLFVLNLLFALGGAYTVRRAAARGEIPKEFGIYATALESSLVVFCLGGTFLSAHYLEMLWHFVGLSLTLRVLATQAARAPVQQAVPATIPALAPAAAAPALAPLTATSFVRRQPVAPPSPRPVRFVVTDPDGQLAGDKS